MADMMFGEPPPFGWIVDRIRRVQAVLNGDAGT